MLINIWHNYSRGENVIITLSILAFSDDANTQNTCFRLIFFCICLMLMSKISYTLLKLSFLSKDGIICYFKSLYYLINLIFVRNVSQKKIKKKLKCNFCFEASEYFLMSKLTYFVIWNNVNSFHYAGTKNLLI